MKKLLSVVVSFMLVIPMGLMAQDAAPKTEKEDVTKVEEPKEVKKDKKHAKKEKKHVKKAKSKKKHHAKKAKAHKKHIEKKDEVKENVDDVK